MATADSRTASVGPIFRLRDFPMEPARGNFRSVEWMQFVGTLQLRLPLRGEEWNGVEEGDFEVAIREREIAVKCHRRGTPGPLQDVSGWLQGDIQAKGSWFCLEWDTRDTAIEQSRSKVLLIELEKRAPGKPWKDGVFSEHPVFRRQFVGLCPNATAPPDVEPEVSTWATLKAGRRRDLEDPFVTSRGWLCNELEQGQTDETIQFRFVLDQKRFDEACEKVAYFKLWGIDISETHLKVFIRGDEHSPVLMGTFGGKCIPDRTTLELDMLTRVVEGHRIGAKETLPCLDIVVTKAKDSMFEWGALLESLDEEEMDKPTGALEEYEQLQLRRQRAPSPDREDWTPDDWADEQKDKANKAFKDGNFRDAIVFYTRALRYTPRNEKLLSNRSAAYMKISKFQLALDDIIKAQEVDPNWAKIYFRKGQVLRSLKRFDDAMLAFQEGKELDSDNPEWDRELQRTTEAQSDL